MGSYSRKYSISLKIVVSVAHSRETAIYWRLVLDFLKIYFQQLSSLAILNFSHYINVLSGPKIY